MTWGQQRQTYIIVGISLIILIPIIVFLSVSLYEKPTCFDGRQNGDENGIDCGGSCKLVCRNSTLPVSTVWSRIFEEKGNITGSALLENKNARAVAVDVPYEFSIFKGEIELSSIDGIVTIPAKKRVPVIIEGLVKGIQNVDYHKFELGEPREWTYEYGEESPLLVSRQIMNTDLETPRVSAQVKNLKFNEIIEDTYFVVFIYDEFESVIDQATTYIKEIKPQETVDIFFTWNSKFSKEAIRFDIIELPR